MGLGEWGWEQGERRTKTEERRLENGDWRTETD
jgi:hypothetical protein